MHYANKSSSIQFFKEKRSNPAKITIPQEFIAEEGNTEAEHLDKLVNECTVRIYGTPLPTDVEERLRYDGIANLT